jgi:hypothetical protein
MEGLGGGLVKMCMPFMMPPPTLPPMRSARWTAEASGGAVTLTNICTCSRLGASTVLVT